jgi:hypothetical protein
MHFTKPAQEHNVIVHAPPPLAAPVIEAWDGNASSGESEEEKETKDNEKEMPELQNKVTTRSGRQVTAPPRLMQEIAESGASQARQAQQFKIGLTAAEENHHSVMSEQWCGEVAAVGMGTGGGFDNTSELRAMKFKEVMQGQDEQEWEAPAVEEEHDRMVHMLVGKPILLRDLPNHTKVHASTWAMKKKANGAHRPRMNACGHEQVDGEHCDSHSISSPVTNEMTIRGVLALMIMAGWVGKLLDVKGAFLHGLRKARKHI